MRQKFVHLSMVVGVLLGLCSMISLNSTALSAGHDSLTEVQRGEEPARTDPGMKSSDQGEGESTPTLPPMKDSEMVVPPPVSSNPDSIVRPPPIDPEMVIDPVTREPITKEELQQLNPVPGLEEPFVPPKK